MPISGLQQSTKNNVSFPKAGTHMVKHMVSKNRVQKHILKKWSPIYALYPPMVHRRSFCGPGPRPKAHGRGPRPNGEASYGDQGPGVQWHPTMGLKVPKTSKGPGMQEIYTYTYMYMLMSVYFVKLLSPGEIWVV